MRHTHTTHTTHTHTHTHTHTYTHTLYLHLSHKLDISVVHYNELWHQLSQHCSHVIRVAIATQQNHICTQLVTTVTHSLALLSECSIMTGPEGSPKCADTGSIRPPSSSLNTTSSSSYSGVWEETSVYSGVWEETSVHSGVWEETSVHSDSVEGD